MSTRITRLSLWLIALLSAASALGPASMQILLPALPVIRTDFDVSAGAAQLTLSLSMLSIAIATLTYGPISDRYGRKPTLIVGILITFLGSLFCLVAPTVELLILGRFVQAFGGNVDVHHVFVHRRFGVGKYFSRQGSVISHQQFMKEEVHQRAVTRVAHGLVIKVRHTDFVGLTHGAQPA